MLTAAAPVRPRTGSGRAPSRLPAPGPRSTPTSGLLTKPYRGSITPQVTCEWTRDWFQWAALWPPGREWTGNASKQAATRDFTLPLVPAVPAAGAGGWSPAQQVRNADTARALPLYPQRAPGHLTGIYESELALWSLSCYKIRPPGDLRQETQQEPKTPHWQGALADCASGLPEPPLQPSLKPASRI